MDGLGDFHFLRPLWLLFILPLGALVYALWQRKRLQTGLETHISHSLLQHLTLASHTKVSHYPLIGLFIAWLVAVISMAGPTWEKLPQPVFESESAVIIALDLSPSMLAEDLKPSRIVRAHLKIQDLLQQRKEGVTALIVYAGEAHTVTPFTDDTQTISNLLATLTPGILPLPGSNPEMAIEVAKDLIQSSRITKASILLITDDIAESAVETISRSLPNTVDLSIIGVGTDSGAPIPYKGDFLKNSQEQNVIAKRNGLVMKNLTRKTNGYYLPIQADNSDVEFYLRHLEQRFSDNKDDDESLSGDRWFEAGQPLLLLLIPFALAAFRRGILLSLICISFTGGLFLQSSPLSADEYSSIWKNKDASGLKAWKDNNYDSASQLFNQPQWQASAYYKKGEYKKALELFKQDDSATGHYNRGNALAHLQQYEEAITAYEQALKKDASLVQAKKNKEIVTRLRREQEKQEDNEKNKDGQDKDEQTKNSEDDPEGRQDEQSNSNKADEDKEESEQNSNSSDSNKDQPSSKPDENKEEPNTNGKESSTSQAKEDKKGDDSEGQAVSNFERLNDEEKQELEQLLRKIPDDPSGLLKRKFEYEFQKRKQLYQQEKWKLPENNAHKRY